LFSFQPSIVLRLVFSRYGQIGIGRLTAFLFEAMQQYHATIFVNIEQHPYDPILIQIRSHLEKALSHWAAYWHADWPSKLNRFDVFADHLPVLLGQILEPLPNGFSSGLGTKKYGRNPLPRSVPVHSL
jgi:hypothetical protein